MEQWGCSAPFPHACLGRDSHMCHPSPKKKGEKGRGEERGNKAFRSRRKHGVTAFFCLISREGLSASLLKVQKLQYQPFRGGGLSGGKAGRHERYSGNPFFSNFCYIYPEVTLALHTSCIRPTFYPYGWCSTKNEGATVTPTAPHRQRPQLEEERHYK